MKKVLIVYLSAGNGHRTAAYALKEAYQKIHANTEVILLDHVELLGLLFGKFVTDGYEFCSNKLPKLYDIAYKLCDIKYPQTITSKFRSNLNNLGKKNLKKFIQETKPDHVICTHFSAGNILGHLKEKGKINLPIHVTITDIGLHQFWVAPGIDNYFVFHEITKSQLIDSGVSKDSIHVSGIALSQNFVNNHEKPKNTQIPLKILAYNTFNHLNTLYSILKEIKKLPQDKYDLTIVGLKDHHIDKVKTYLKKNSMEATVHGFYKPLIKLLKESDIIIGKSGGALTAECLSLGLPMLVLKPIPGQEETNSKFLHNHQCGIHIKNLSEISYQLKRFINSPKNLDHMKQIARLQGKPKAADDIVNIISNYSSSRTSSLSASPSEASVASISGAPASSSPS